MIRARGKGRWEIVVYAGKDPITGKERRVSRIFEGSKVKARDRERDLIAEHRSAPVSAELTVDELLDRWLPAARLEASTVARTESYLRRHVRPALGPVHVDRIRPDDLNQFYLQLEKGTDDRDPLAPSTVVRIHGIVRAALEYAVTNGWVATNPARRARPPELPPPDTEGPDVDQVLALLARAREKDPELFAFLRLSAATGMRPGSVAGVHYKDLDLLDHELRHHRAIGLGKGAPYEKSTKSGGRHPIALDRSTVAVLRWHGWRMRIRARSLDTELAGDAYVFSRAPDGATPWRPDYISKRYRRLADAAGITGELRTLRHFSATALIDAGIDISVVSKRHTHARTSTTLDRYKDRMPATDRAAATVMGEQLRRRRITPV